MHAAFRNRHHHRPRSIQVAVAASAAGTAVVLPLPPLLPLLLPPPQPPLPSSTASPPPSTAPLPHNQPSPPPSLPPLPSPPRSLTASTANAHRRYPRHHLQIRRNSRRRRSSHHFTAWVHPPRNPDTNALLGASYRPDLAYLPHCPPGPLMFQSCSWSGGAELGPI